MDERWSRPLDEYAEEQARSVRAVMKDMGPQLRGMPIDQAERVLADVLPERDLVVPPGLVRSLARMAGDPLEPIKHPLKTAKLRRRDDRLSEAESRRAQAESAAVSRRVESVIDSFSDDPIDWS